MDFSINVTDTVAAAISVDNLLNNALCAVRGRPLFEAERSPLALRIKIGSAHEVVVSVKEYPAKKDWFLLTVYRNSSPVQSDELEALGYYSGCKDVNVAQNFDGLLHELRSLQDMFGHKYF
jgi:hypothetical protein